MIRQGKKSKEKVDVFSFELLAYRQLVNPRALPPGDPTAEKSAAMESFAAGDADGEQQKPKAKSRAKPAAKARPAKKPAPKRPAAGKSGSKRQKK